MSNAWILVWTYAFVDLGVFILTPGVSDVQHVVGASLINIGLLILDGHGSSST